MLIYTLNTIGYINKRENAFCMPSHFLGKLKCFYFIHSLALRLVLTFSVGFVYFVELPSILTGKLVTFFTGWEVILGAELCRPFTHWKCASGGCWWEVPGLWWNRRTHKNIRPQKARRSGHSHGTRRYILLLVSY